MILLPQACDGCLFGTADPFVAWDEEEDGNQRNVGHEEGICEQQQQQEQQQERCLKWKRGEGRSGTTARNPKKATYETSG